MKDQEFVEYVVKALVDNPEKVKVDRRVDGDQTKHFNR